MIFDFDVKKCVEAKAILGKNSHISSIWRDNFSGSNHVGNCTNLYSKLRPVSYEDFYRKYIEYAEKNKFLRISQRGLTYDELLDLAKSYKQKSENKTLISNDLSVYFYDALCHVIVETFDGQKKERDFIKFLTSLGYKCSHFDGKTDATYGVDIRVERDDGRVSAIQIKPISFFKSNREDVQKDRINLCYKYENTLRDLGIKTYYAIYQKKRDSNEIDWIKNGKGYRFRINELFNYDPLHIEETFVRRKLPETVEKLPI